MFEKDRAAKNMAGFGFGVAVISSLAYDGGISWATPFIVFGLVLIASGVGWYYAVRRRGPRTF